MAGLAAQTKVASPLAYRDDDRRWAAVESRDPAADGAFYYAVRTTGIYCRPSCAARRAKRANVSFYVTAEEAEHAGFRPCKRCRPNESSDSSAAERHTTAVTTACQLIREADEPPSLATLASAVGMSRYHFHRVFKNVLGVTPKAFADAHRAERMQNMLEHDNTITDAMYGAGYNSGGPFYAGSSARLGMTPGAFRADGAGATIRFAVGQCSLGAILVAATDKGICAIWFGDDPEALVHELEDRFSKARLVGGDAAFEQRVAQVVGLVEAPANPVDLPLDVRGTAFQQRVWQALCRIPPGSTATYAEIAARIGRPRAARAVANACAHNSLAVAIPCHRVVRSDGALASYRWGVERKRVLLERESAV